MIRSFQVFDTFLENPGAVRESALRVGFSTWNPGKGTASEAHLDGMGFGGAHATLTRALMQATGVVVAPQLTHFRLTSTRTDRATIHSDAHMAPYTCIVYLSAQNPGSTAFWRHKETGLTSLPDNCDTGLFAKLTDDMAKSRSEDWEMIDVISGEYNRALVFNAPLFHCRYPMEDRGTTDQDSRLVWVSHFYNFQEMK